MTKEFVYCVRLHISVRPYGAARFTSYGHMDFRCFEGAFKEMRTWFSNGDSYKFRIEADFMDVDSVKFEDKL